MRILFLSWRDLAHPLAGGAEVYTHEVARRLVERGHEVTLFCARPKTLLTEEWRDGVKVVRRGSRLGVYRRAARYYEQAEPPGFDVVVDEVNTRPFLAPVFVRDVPVLALVFQLADDVWMHELSFPAALFGRHVLEPRWLRPYGSVPTLTISESSRASLLERGLCDVKVIPVGLEPTPDPDEAREEQPTLLFVGRLAANKRADHAVKAFRLLQAQLPDAQLWIVGSGPEEAKLRRRAPHGVYFHGRVSPDEKYRLMARAHALVATSVREGWGMTVSEAAAMGTRTVAYDVPGLRDSVAAAGGELVRAEPEALAERLIEVLPKWGGRRDRLPTGVVSWDEVTTAVETHLVAVRTRPTSDSRLPGAVAS